MNHVNASNLNGRTDDGKDIRHLQELDGKVKRRGVGRAHVVGPIEISGQPSQTPCQTLPTKSQR
jgi:hypothetical protein